jgi:N-methylhydantoinase A
LTISACTHDLTPEAMAELLEDFGQEHEKTYGYRSDNEPVELVNVRLTARGVPVRSRLPETLSLPDEPCGAMPESRRVYFGPEHGYLDTPLQPRTALGEAGQHGPLIVEEYDATTVIPPGCRAMLDAWGNIVVEVEMVKERA